MRPTLEALLPDSGVLVRVYLWETDVAPDMGRPQEVINSQNGDYDIFIGMMWKRVGTNSGAAPSGTVEEFRIACERRRREGKPVVMFYFNTSPIDLPHRAGFESDPDRVAMTGSHHAARMSQLRKSSSVVSQCFHVKSAYFLTTEDVKRAFCDVPCDMASSDANL